MSSREKRMLGKANLIAVALVLFISSVPTLGASEDIPNQAPVRAELAPVGANQGAGASNIVLHQHQDCVDEAAGVLGPAPHGTHDGPDFVPGNGPITITLDVFNLATATCLPTSAANQPPRNGYVGHYNFKLIDVGAQHDQGPPPDGETLRFDCEYVGAPTLVFGNYACSGLGYFWVGRYHEIVTTIDPTVNILGLNVPSTGAVELTASQ